MQRLSPLPRRPHRVHEEKSRGPLRHEGGSADRRASCRSSFDRAARTRRIASTRRTASSPPSEPTLTTAARQSGPASPGRTSSARCPGSLPRTSVRGGPKTPSHRLHECAQSRDARRPRAIESTKVPSPGTPEEPEPSNRRRCPVRGRPKSPSHRIDEGAPRDRPLRRQRQLRPRIQLRTAVFGRAC